MATFCKCTFDRTGDSVNYHVPSDSWAGGAEVFSDATFQQADPSTSIWVGPSMPAVATPVRRA